MDETALAEAIRGAQRGDADAFDRLVDAYAPRLYGFLFRLTGSRLDAEDLAQEVFLRMVRMIASYSHNGRFEPWLFRIAANLVRDRVRRLRRAPGIVGGSGDGQDAAGGSPIDGVASDEPDGERRLILSEDVEAMNDALAALPEVEREVVLLRHYSQMSFKDIAEMTGVPLGTALARGHRGLAKLRRMLEQQDATNERDVRSMRAAARG